jgi:patatin-like phospholipase/acyl hydrolase
MYEHMLMESLMDCMYVFECFSKYEPTAPHLPNSNSNSKSKSNSNNLNLKAHLKDWEDLVKVPKPPNHVKTVFDKFIYKNRSKKTVLHSVHET